jgi:hypothetical protein
MPRLNLNEVLNDPEVKLYTDRWEWEHRCGACDNFCDPIKGYSQFATKKCPKEGKVNADTDWTAFNCPDFYD